MIKQKERRKQKVPQPSVADAKKRGLGRGLSDLGLTELLGLQQNTDHRRSTESESQLTELPVHTIRPGPYQPRRRINQAHLQELADSIRMQGIIQPIIVRRTSKANDHEIIAGERRWRAAQLAGLATVPAIIRDVADSVAMAFAVIENIQRENLNAIDEALALQRLLQECRMTHQTVAEALGKSRTSVTNSLRLLKLNAEVRTWVEEGKLEMGHARALLAWEGSRQTEYARQVIEKQLSVRETEALVQKLQTLPRAESGQRERVDPDIARLQRDLSDKLGATVFIQYGEEGKGKLVIRYNSVEELEGILERIR